MKMKLRKAPVLHHIEVENFKSYRGQITIGPLKTFNAVIGPNGSGSCTKISSLLSFTHTCIPNISF